MARYFFNLQDGRAFPDNHGQDLRSLQDARIAAIHYAGETLRRLGNCGWEGEESLLRVTNERGTLLFTISFCATDALAHVGSPS